LILKLLLPFRQIARREDQKFGRKRPWRFASRIQRYLRARASSIPRFKEPKFH
jgi:hypothetical protein